MATGNAQIKALAEKGQRWTSDAKAQEIFGQIAKLASGKGDTAAAGSTTPAKPRSARKRTTPPTK